jgi:hypothetical protein
MPKLIERKAKLPEWVADTPSKSEPGHELQDGPWSPEYRLDMCCLCGCIESLQQIEMTRQEFTALKRHLAELRGFKIPKEAA